MMMTRKKLPFLFRNTSNIPFRINGVCGSLRMINKNLGQKT
jgi:hypothetical protein